MIDMPELPTYSPPITSTAAQGINYFNFSDPQVLTWWILIALILILVLKRLWDTYKDISGQRVLEQDGGIITLIRADNNAVKDKILTYGKDRSVAIDHGPYRIVTILGVQLTLWIADRLKGRTIGLEDLPLRGIMSADEQNEIIRAIPERELGTIRTDKGLTFTLLALGAGAFIGYMLANLL